MLLRSKIDHLCREGFNVQVNTERVIASEPAVPIVLPLTPPPTPTLSP